MRIAFLVDSETIDRGYPNDPTRCPIALALTDVGCTEVFVSPVFIGFMWHGMAYSQETPKEIAEWINTYDLLGTNGPISVVIDSEDDATVIKHPQQEPLPLTVEEAHEDRFLRTVAKAIAVYISGNRDANPEMADRHLAQDMLADVKEYLKQKDI